MSTTKKVNSATATSQSELKDQKAICGVIMPLSPMDGYPVEHWPMVQTILYEAINAAGFQPDMVSNSDEVSVIQKNIVQNIYNNEIIVCDISGRNANVMFELGMRLTFDKPTVIVKDDSTPTPFDTSIIEYIPYRKDLRYAEIQDFKRKLTAKLLATHKLKDDPEYSPFIKHFGPFTVPKLEQKEVSPMDYVIERLNILTKEVRSISNIQSEGRAQRGLLYKPNDPLDLFNYNDGAKIDNLYIPLKKLLDDDFDIFANNEDNAHLMDWIEERYYEIVPEAIRYKSLVQKWMRQYLLERGIAVKEVSTGEHKTT